MILKFNPNIILTRDTKLSLTSRKEIGNVCDVRNNVWCSLPAIGVLGGILLIWVSLVVDRGDCTEFLD